MSQRQDVEDIVQSFVNNDLASLDRFGDHTDTFTLSPHLAQTTPDLAPIESGKTEFDASENTTSKTGPQLSQAGTGSAAVTNSGHTENNHADPGGLNPDGQLSQSKPYTDSKLDQARFRSAPGSAYSAPDSSDTVATAGSRQGRQTSVSSVASMSTAEREKSQSLGDRFKKFGKRIASGSKK